MAELERIKSFIDRIQNEIIEYRKRLDKRSGNVGYRILFTQSEETK